MALLDVTDLKTFFHTRAGVVRAVNGVSFSVEKGETLGIVGESGSGKSVACYSLMGLIPKPPGRIESGKALFEGEDLLQMSEAQLNRIRGRRIAMIFQDPMTSLNPFLRIEDQLIEPLLLHGVTDKATARKFIDEFIERFPHDRRLQEIEDLRMDAECVRLHKRLVKDSILSGSWDSSTVWGGHGGRVYATAMATLCLEVYYRYLPIYERTAVK